MTSPSSILALELCMRLDPDLRGHLHALVRDHPAKTGLQDKWELYRAASSALFGRLDLAEKGCWDYFDDDERAKGDFEMWSNGMITEEGARPGPSGAPDPYRGSQRYMTFTMAFLFVQNSQVDFQISQLCSIPQPDLWKRRSFARILAGLGALSFSVVQADVLYLIPGDPTWGLTADDLTAPKFHYLRTIEE